MDAISVSDCEKQCHRVSYCVSFSYRDNTSRDNCKLSSLSNLGAQNSFDLEFDREWDVFRLIFGGRCGERDPGAAVPSNFAGGFGNRVDGSGGE